MAKQYFIVMDESHINKIEEGSATVEGAKLTFKRNMFLGLFGGEKQELEFDRRKLIASKKRLIAYYELDSTGNITQLSFKDIQDVSVASEFNTLYELGKAIEESGLKPPKSLAQLLEWLVIGVLLIVFIGGIYQGSQLNQTTKNLVKPLNKSIALTEQFGTYTANVCNLAIKLANSTLTYVNASNAALRRAQTP